MLFRIEPLSSTCAPSFRFHKHATTDLTQGVVSLRQRIRSQGTPWPRWRSARPGPHKTLGVERHFLNQDSRPPVDCQAISLPPPADFVGRSRRINAVGRSRERACEAELATLLAAELDAGRLLDLATLRAHFAPDLAALPIVSIATPSLAAYATAASTRTRRSVERANPMPAGPLLRQTA